MALSDSKVREHPEEIPPSLSTFNAGNLILKRRILKPRSPISGLHDKSSVFNDAGKG